MSRQGTGLATCAALAAWLFAANIADRLSNSSQQVEEAYSLASEAYGLADEANDRAEEVCRRIRC